tara:strand:- start:1205 stop:1849 length:645 start_codon:yes stop_codon:yes gene_type:complete
MNLRSEWHKIAGTSNAALFLVCCLAFLSTGFQARAIDQQISNTTSLPKELLRPNVSVLKGVETVFIAASPGARAAGVYVATGSSGVVSKQGAAHLLLIDPKTGDFLRITTAAEIKGTKFNIQWLLPRQNSIGDKIQIDSRRWKTANERSRYGFKPDILMYVSEATSVIEIDTSNMIYYFMKNNGNYLKFERSRIGGTGREAFDRFDVKLPMKSR